MKSIFLLLMLVIQPTFAKNFPIKLGNSKVIIHYQKGKGTTYVHLHRNETTALKAAKATIKARGGSLITLMHPGGRNIHFTLHKKHYVFDPNRIFSDKGIRKTLEKNSRYTPAAAREVKKLANTIKGLIRNGKIVAVHNNQYYSLKNYLPGHALASDAKSLYYNRHQNHRNFSLVTQKRAYRRFKRAGLNAIWQNRYPADDGSLSVYLAKREYINVEAGYNQMAVQMRMLKVA